MDNHNNRYNNVVLGPGISGVNHSTLMKAIQGNLHGLEPCETLQFLLGHITTGLAWLQVIY